MDNGKTVAFISLGAIGSLLAYYGYSQYTEEKIENSEVVKTTEDGDGKSKMLDTVPLKPACSKSTENEPTVEVSIPPDADAAETENIISAVKGYLQNITQTRENEKITDKTTKSLPTVPETDASKWSNYWKKEYAKQHETNMDENDTEQENHESIPSSE